MTRHACMLRAVNVSGQRPLKMSALRALCISLGCSDVETYLQSGNVIAASRQPPAKLGASISTAIAKEFGYDNVDVLVWTAAELSALVRASPFLARGASPSELYVTFLAKKVKASDIQALGTERYLPDEFAPGAKAIYVHCLNGYGRTKLNNSFFERKLGVRATTRNWQTVTKLCELANKFNS